MNPFLWDKYTTTEVNDKIRYWVDLWESLIDKIGDPSLGLVFMNPHLLVRHIIDEVVFNNFQNPDNRAFFQKQLEHFVEADPATKKLFAADLALIRREFGGTRFGYLLKLCRTVDISYSHSPYLDELFRSLRTIFSNATWQPGDEDAIRTICQCMIVELTLAGYSLDTIKRFPESVFDKTTGFIFNNRYPSSVKEEDFVRNGVLDIPAYRAAIQAEVDSLTVDSRLDAFCRYFHPKAQESYFIYQVEGLKGDSLDITIANVNLYSPKTKRYIKTIPGNNPDSLRNDELFGSQEEACFANAAVRLNEFDATASEKAAVEQIEKALDLFRTFVTSDVPFKVLANHYIRVSPDGEYWGSGQRGASSHDPAYKHFRSIDLGKLAGHAFEDRFLESAGEHLFQDKTSDSAGLRIAHSLHWYRKAEESQTSEDRLLGYWIVLENIVSVERSDRNVLLPEKEKETKFSLIREIVPALDACVHISTSAAYLYQLLVGLLTSSTNGRPHLTLPDELLEKSLLRVPPGSSVDLATFVSHLGAVADAIPRKVIKDEVVRVQKLYSDVTWAKEELSGRVRATKDELLMLYRLRNRIVHNAHYDNSMLPLWIEKARRYAGNTIRQVLHDLFVGRERSIESSLLRYHVALARIQQRLEKGVPVDFLQWEM